MRIAITLQSLDTTWGGIGVYTDEVVKHLLRLDRNNEYVLLYPGFGAARKLLGRFQRKYANVIEIETESSRFPSGFYWDQVVVPKVAKAHGADVLFNPFLSVPIRGRFKKVMIMHAVEYHTVPAVYDWRLYARWFFLEKALLPASDRLISISEVMTEDLCRVLSYPREHIRTIYHGVSEKFRVIRDRERLDYVRAEYVLPKKYILFVGHLYPQKNFSNLMKAFNKIAEKIEEDLVVAGRPRWKFRGDLELIETLGLKDRVHFLYFVPNDDLPAIYTLATCFVFPSFYEAFGLAQMEAMACGCPVAAARAGAIPEVTGGAALLFDPNDVDEMAERLLSLIDDEGLRATYVDKGLRRAAEFTWDRCASQTLQLLEEAGRD